mmetsp:Transcript_8579/g.20977  ORF Transcript_8579/g.20977 Transcript_8579/m.20977 type:complete len:503 (+) Transcript_8579:95-1603(+)
MVDRNKCTEKRDIEIPDCKESNPDDCKRSFHIYLPSIICDGRRALQNSADVPSAIVDDSPSSSSSPPPPSPEEAVFVGTLPLVFALHCFGCHVYSIAGAFVDHADAHDVVLVLPQGLQNSFNARHCCGYALQNEVDDVGFLKHVQSMLTEEYEFVNSEYSYAVGWSNGGFLAMHAASLFRSISAISGHVYDIDPDLKKSGTFCVDGICVDAPGTGKGLFLHHGLDDTFVRPTGCCNDPDLPKCCCGIEAETCVPVMEVARRWATEVNKCELAEEEEAVAAADDPGDSDDEGDKDVEKEAVEGEEAKEEEKDDDSAKFITSSYTNPDAEIECLTAIGKGCISETTICMHANVGHFNKPNFLEAFPFGREVMGFFARDACELNGGVWNATGSECASCPEKFGGTFCLDNAKAVEKVLSIRPAEDVYDDVYGFEPGATTATSPRGTRKVAIGYYLLAIAIIGYVIRHRYRRDKKKDDRYFSRDVRDDDAEEEVTELVPSRGFRTS